ncbi:hypothetical protein IAT40_001363 [Kwoniella sp. CBS 6097]
MPTDVTPSYSYSVPIPIPMIRTPACIPGPMHQGWLSQSSRSSPPDPARAPAGSSWDSISKRHIPGAILANGTRCDWTPYAGESYIPAANNVLGAEARQVRSCAGAGTLFTPNTAAIAASAAGGGGSMGLIMPGGASSVGGGSMLSRESYGSVGSGSVVPPIGGYREDDGWAGSTGRAHLGHAPDMSTTAGAIGLGPASGVGVGVGGSRVGSSMGFSHAPSGYGNHARMTPGVAAGLGETELLTPMSSPSHRSLPAPVSILKGKHHNKQSSIRYDADCADCRRGDRRRRRSELGRRRGCRECQ